MVLNRLNNYSFFGIIRLFNDLLYTKLFFPTSRLIRRPFYIRGKKYINLGSQLTTGVGCRLDAFPKSSKVCIQFGQDVQINDYVHIGAIDSIYIGNNVLIASKVFITDHNHGLYGHLGIHSHPDTPPVLRELSIAPVIIEDNVWIGEFVSILLGVTIGKGSVIGTMSVVTKSIPPYSIAVGSPAKVIKRFDFLKKEGETV
ncbi:MAG TPA: DapH/DapD/GlmU-related protein [Atribacterota bacterium]|nr:DapH/DapD/GlmU-related protein [Atribacterota bacterium]